MTSNKFRMRYLAALSVAAFMAGGAAFAQGTSPAQQTAPAAPAQITPVTYQEVTQYVAANRKVTEVANKMSVELQGASTESDVATIQDKAEKEIVSAIQKEGLTATRYQEIIILAESDQATLAKLQAAIGG